MQILPAEFAPREVPAPAVLQGLGSAADPSATAAPGSANGGFAAVLAESAGRSSSTSGDSSTKSGIQERPDDGKGLSQQAGGAPEAGSSAVASTEVFAEEAPVTARNAAPSGAQGDAREGVEVQRGETPPPIDEPAAGLPRVPDVAPAAASGPAATAGAVDLEAAVPVADPSATDLVGDASVGEGLPAAVATPAGEAADGESTDESPEAEGAGTTSDAVAGSLPHISAAGATPAAELPGVPQTAAGGADPGSSPDHEKAAISAHPQTPRSPGTAPSALDAQNAAGTSGKDGLPSLATASSSALEQAPSGVRTGAAKSEMQGADGRLVDERANGTGAATAQSTVAPLATARDGAGSAASGGGPQGEGRDAHAGRSVVEHATVAPDAEADGGSPASEEPAVSSLRTGASAGAQMQAGRPAAALFGAASKSPGGSASIVAASTTNGDGAGTEVPSRTFDESALMGSGSHSSFPQGETSARLAGSSSTATTDAARTAGTMARVEQAIEAGLERGLVGRLRDDGQMRLAVRSDELGELDVRVAVRESGVHATIGASHEEARQLLHSQRADLAAALERYNLRLDSFSVDVGGQGSRSGMRQEDAHGPFAHQAALPSDDPQGVVARSASPNPNRVGGLSVRA